MKEKKKQHYFSFRLILFLILLVLMFGSLASVEVLEYNSFKKAALDNRKDKISNQCMVLANQIVESGVIYTGLTGHVSEAINQMAEDYNGRAMIVNSLGMVIYDTADIDTKSYLLDSRVLKALDGKTTMGWMNSDQYSLLMTMPLTGSSSGMVIGAMVFTASATDIRTIMSRVQRNMFSTDLVVLTILILFMIFWVSYFGKPFVKLRQSIQKVSDGEQKNMDPLPYKETKEIVSAFNVLVDHMNKQDELRRQFVSNVSHELKTPITSMRVLADSLLSMPDAPKELYQEFMADISSEIDREAKIISDLLELVRMDNSAVTLTVSAVNINEWLSDILHRLIPIANKQNVEVVMESFRDVIAEIDPSKLSLAISNLVENAIKYNKENGYVHVSLNADHKYFFIKVEDNGVGIPEDAIDKIFDRFYRVDKARSRDAGGTGLGLAITKSVIQTHRGLIKVYSKVGEGTTFSVRIPLQYKEKEQEGQSV